MSLARTSSTLDARTAGHVRRWLPTVAAAWTLFIWGSRVRNALDDDDLSSGGLARALVTALTFVVVAAVVLLADNRRRGSIDRYLGPIAVATAAYWALRMVIIAAGDHSAAFVVVHLVLGVVSAGLAAAAWRARRVAA